MKIKFLLRDGSPLMKDMDVVMNDVPEIGATFLHKEQMFIVDEHRHYFDEGIKKVICKIFKPNLIK